jgi:hypothetical protein
MNLKEVDISDITFDVDEPERTEKTESEKTEKTEVKTEETKTKGVKSETKKNAFAALGKKSKAKKKESTVKVSVETDEKTKELIDEFCTKKAKIAKLEQEQESASVKIIDFVRPRHDKLARSGEFTKSVIAEGNKSRLTFVTADKFVVPQDEETQEELRKFLGDRFDNFFETDETIKIKSSVDLEKLAEQLEKAGIDIAEIFEKDSKLVTKKGLDQKQFQLSEEDLTVFRTLVRQYKPSLKANGGK